MDMTGCSVAPMRFPKTLRGSTFQWRFHGKRLGGSLGLLSLIFLLTATGFAQEGPTGRVDWVNGYVSGFGIGMAEEGSSKGLARTSSLRAAKVDALRNLLKTIHRMRIDPQIRVENYITSENAAGTRISGLIKGARMVDHKTQWLSDSPLTTVEMRVCISTSGKGCSNGNSLISALDLVAFKGHPQASESRYAGADKSFWSSLRERVGLHDPDIPITGVVFSLGSLPYERVVLPEIVAKGEKGVKTVYSALFVEPDLVRTLGIVRFTDTLDQAQSIERIGTNYLVVPVEDVAEDNTLIISNLSAQQIYASTRKGNDYLKMARVVISAE